MEPAGNSRTVMPFGLWHLLRRTAERRGHAVPSHQRSTGQTVVSHSNRIHEDQLCQPTRYRGQPVYSRPVALPASTFTIDKNLLPPYAQDWNLTIDQSLGNQNLSIGYIGSKGPPAAVG